MPSITWLHPGDPNRLDEFKSLEEDWDSYGADPISPKAIVTAKNLLRTCSRPDFIAPLADGGVQLEWECPDINRGAEVEISAEGKAELEVFNLQTFAADFCATVETDGG